MPAGWPWNGTQIRVAQTRQICIRVLLFHHSHLFNLIFASFSTYWELDGRSFDRFFVHAAKGCLLPHKILDLCIALAAAWNWSRTSRSCRLQSSRVVGLGWLLGRDDHSAWGTLQDFLWKASQHNSLSATAISHCPNSPLLVKPPLSPSRIPPLLFRWDHSVSHISLCHPQRAEPPASAPDNDLLPIRPMTGLGSVRSPHCSASRHQAGWTVRSQSWPPPHLPWLAEIHPYRSGRLIQLRGQHPASMWGV